MESDGIGWNRMESDGISRNFVEWDGIGWNGVRCGCAIPAPYLSGTPPRRGGGVDPGALRLGDEAAGIGRNSME